MTKMEKTNQWVTAITAAACMLPGYALLVSVAIAGLSSFLMAWCLAAPFYYVGHWVKTGKWEHPLLAGDEIRTIKGRL